MEQNQAMKKGALNGALKEGLEGKGDDVEREGRSLFPILFGT